MGDYCTRDEVKARLPDLGSDQDALIDTLKAQSSRDIERLTGQTFEPVTGATRTFDGSGTSKLILPWQSPIVTVTTLKIRTGGEGSSLVTISSSDYFLEPANRIGTDPARWIELGAGINSGVTIFTAGKRTVEIAGDWVRSAIPADINDLCIEMVVTAFRGRGSGSTEGQFGGMDLDSSPRLLTPRAVAILKAHGYQAGWMVP